MANNVELSERECEILRLVATGASNKEIAQDLYISTNTVKVHLRNIFTKIEVTSRTEATLYAIRAGLVSAPVAIGMAPATDGLAVDLLPEDSRVLTDESLPPVQPRKARRWAALAGLVALLLIAAAAGASWMRRAGIIGLSPDEQVTQSAPTRWQIHTNLSTARGGLAAAAYEGQIYAIAGETDQGVTGAVSRYDPTANRWEEVADKPLPVADVQAVLLGEKIYVPGGRRADGTLTDQMDVYNPRRGEWEQKASLPAPRSAYALAAYEGHLYLFGGWDGAQVVDTVYEYDPLLDRWEERAPMPTARAYAGAAAAAGKIFVIGGTDGDQPLTANQVYYPQREQDGDTSWESAQSLPEARSHLALAGLADVIYVLGGRPAEAGADPTALGFITQQSVWQEFEKPPAPVGEQAVVVSLGNYLYVLGGNLAGTPAANCQSYQAIFTVVLPYIQ